MLNKIKYDNSIILSYDKNGRNNFALLEDGRLISSKKLHDFKIDIFCTKCQNSQNIRWGARLLKKEYICMRCHGLYNNPFKGKKHTEEFKQKLSEDRKGIRLNPHSKSVYDCWIEKYGQEKANELIESHKEKLSIAFSGDKNYFYQREFTEEQKNRRLASQKKYLESLTDEEKEKISLNMSKAALKFKSENPGYYREIKSRGGKAAAASHVKYKINKLEKIVQDKLLELGLDFKYSVILDFKQFDFGNKKNRILLEVQGDYWHANPNIYTENINSMQIKNVERDALKKEFAAKHNFKLFYIWEQDVMMNNFDVLYDIKRIIENEI